MGQVGEHSYTISQKMPGRGLQSLTKAEYIAALPSLIETLFAIHQTNVQDWRHYGWIGDDGEGRFPTWQSFIGRVSEEERPDGFYGQWHTLFQTTFLERDFFEQVYQRMMDLLQFCPPERWLVHGEYGYNNVLVENGRVTAVLDWTDAMYGDFVYDIAAMDFWLPKDLELPRRIEQYYAGQGMAIANYAQRITCYKCCGGLDAMRFFAKTNDQAAYHATRQILQGLLER